MLRAVEREFILWITTSIFLGFHMSAWRIEASSAMDPISIELSESEQGFYQELVNVAKQSKNAGQHPRPVVVITDVGKDYDDLAALVVLTEYHHIGLVELRAVVANLLPAERRAHLAKAALDSLGVRDVPVGRGTRGSPNDHEVFDHEFEGAEFSRGDFEELEDGQDLLLEVYQNAKEKGEKLHLLCLSSLQDIQEFASTHEHLVAECTADVYMQGGNHLSENRLEPDKDAANNRFNIEAAEKWHLFLQTHNIPSHTYTKVIAFVVPLTSELFVELESTRHPIGAYLRRVQVEQDLAFYKRACESDPRKRFAPFMDQEWFLANKTNWHASEGGINFPTGEEIIPYLTKIVLYDVHAALGIAGDDVVRKMGMLLGRKNRLTGEGLELQHKGATGATVLHWIYVNDNHLSKEVKEKISLAIASLLKGALLRVSQQGGFAHNIGYPSPRVSPGVTLEGASHPKCYEEEEM